MTYAQLTMLLRYLSDNRRYHYIEELHNATLNIIDVTIINLLVMLNKLHKDGFITVEQQARHETNAGVTRTRMVDGYFISFEGAILLESGGYKTKLRNERIELRLKNTTNFFLIFGGVAAGIYYTVELLKMIC